MASLDLHVPVKSSRAATYDHLIAFERYDEFARSVREVRRDAEDDSLVQLSYSVAGMRRRHELRVELDRDNWTMHWRSIDGPEHAGTAILEKVNPQRCALGLKVELRTSGVVDTAGATLGVVRARLERDMNNFANFVELETGRRPPAEAPDHRAPSEKLFDKLFPTDETKPGPKRS